MPTKNDKKSIAKALVMPLFTLVVVVIATVYILNNSFGWFTRNRVVTGEGLNVEATQKDSLIIAGSKEEIAAYNSEKNYLTYYFNWDAKTLSAATETKAGLLQYITNPEDIDPLTGVAENELIFADAESGKNYVDCVTFIGTVSERYDYESLSMTVDSGKIFSRCAEGEKGRPGTTYYKQNKDKQGFKEVSVAAGSDVSSYYIKGLKANADHALSAQVFVGEGKQQSYKGTINLNGNSKLTLFNQPGEINHDEPIVITLRCYFDGALIDTNGKAFVRTVDVQTAGVSFGVYFDAPIKLVNE